MKHILQKLGIPGIVFMLGALPAGLYYTAVNHLSDGTTST